MMSQKPAPKIYIFAGELSGDLHGASLLKALNKRFGAIDVTGVAGPGLRALGVKGPLKMEDFCVMGFGDVLMSLPRLWRQFRQVRSSILEKSPEIAIFVDSPSFSLPMAKSLRKHGFKGKIVQYISPTVWAWKRNRVQKMAESFDLLLTIYPFEAQHFADTDLRVVYVGNPLREAIHLHAYDTHWPHLFGIKPDAELVALFPGSRRSEILHNLPPQLEAAKLLKKRHDKTVLAISCANEHHRGLVQEILQSSGFKLNQDVILVPKAYTYDLMRSCRSAIAKSGTVTLELAMHSCPTMVIFKMSWFNKMIAKHILRINLPHYCIVNILGGNRIFPEIIAEGLEPENIIKRWLPLHEEGTARSACIEGCKHVQNMLQGIDASDKAASAISRMSNHVSQVVAPH